MLADGATRHLALSFSGGTLTLGSADTYSGGTTINAGTLTLGNAMALGIGGLTMSGGILDPLMPIRLLFLALSGAAGTITDNSVTAGTINAGP